MNVGCIITFYIKERKEYLLVASKRDVDTIRTKINEQDFHHLFYYNQTKYKTSNCYKVRDKNECSLLEVIKKLACQQGLDFEAYDSFDLSFPASFLKKS